MSHNIVSPKWRKKSSINNTYHDDIPIQYQSDTLHKHIWWQQEYLCKPFSVDAFLTRSRKWLFPAKPLFAMVQFMVIFMI